MQRYPLLKKSPITINKNSIILDKMSERNRHSNRPFEDKLSPFINNEVEKKIDDIFSRLSNKIGNQNSNLKRDLTNEVKRLDDVFSKLSHKVGNQNSNLKRDLTNEVKRLDEDLDKLDNYCNSLDEDYFKLQNYSKNHSKFISDNKQQIDSILENLNLIKNQVTNSENNTDVLKKEIIGLKEKCLPILHVSINQNTKKEVGTVHFQFKTLLKIVSTGLNVFLVGPAGSGKTTAAQQCAEALDLQFYFTGAIASEFKLTGFIDANGKIVSTEFRKAYEEGGLFLFDEIDGSYPQAVLAFNAALSNDYMDFPDKRIKRHENFYCIAAANTYGQGADRQYVGRNQLDAASLDRFVFLNWKYDEDLEKKLSNLDTWVEYVQRIRKIIADNSIRHIISPRASIFGAKLLKNNIDRDQVEELVLWKGLDKSTIQLIKNKSNSNPWYR